MSINALSIDKVPIVFCGIEFIFQALIINIPHTSLYSLGIYANSPKWWLFHTFLDLLQKSDPTLMIYKVKRVNQIWRSQVTLRMPKSFVAHGNHPYLIIWYFHCHRKTAYNIHSLTCIKDAKKFCTPYYSWESSLFNYLVFPLLPENGNWCWVANILSRTIR